VSTYPINSNYIIVFTKSHFSRQTTLKITG